MLYLFIKSQSPIGVSTEKMIDVISPSPPRTPPTQKIMVVPNIMLINSSTLSNYAFGCTSVGNALNNEVFYSMCGICFTFTKGRLGFWSFFLCGVWRQKSFWLLMFSLVQLRALPSSNRKSFINFFFQISNLGFHLIRPFLEQRVYNKS